MNQTQSTFLQNVVLAAQQSQREFGVPASITIAQAIDESGWGQSALAKQANNYFGIKASAHATPDEYVEFQTEEFVDGRATEEMAKFARFASPVDSFHAHGYLLSMALRYRPAMAVKSNPAEFAQELQACGYSTNPEYAAGLMKAVADYDLTQYDVLPIAATSPTVAAEPRPELGAEEASVAARAAGQVVATLHAPAGASTTVATAIGSIVAKKRPPVVSAAGPSSIHTPVKPPTQTPAQTKATPATPAKVK